MNENRAEQFSKYVVPSMLAMILAGFYGIVDGFFIGRAMGDVGLAAINIAWPLLALMTGAGVGIGTGGSVLLSVALGRGDAERAREIRGETLAILAFSSALLMLAYVFAAPAALRLLGAKGELFSCAESYIRVITFGCVFQVVGTGLMPVIKNLGRPMLAMALMAVGMCINIALDAALVGPFGLGGVAFATCFAQAVVAVISLAVLVRAGMPERWWRIKGCDAAGIVRIGASPFGLSFAPSIVIIFCNLCSLRYGGTTACAAYTVMSYAEYVLYSLMEGLADGVQPLVSFCRGAGDREGLRGVMRKAVLLAAALSAGAIFLCVVFRSGFPVFYGVSPEAVEMSASAMLAVAASAPFVAAVRLMSAYFYAAEDSLPAAVLVYTDPLVFTPLFLAALPPAFGYVGIWAAYPLTQAAVTAIGCAFLILRRRRGA